MRVQPQGPARLHGRSSERTPRGAAPVRTGHVKKLRTGLSNAFQKHPRHWLASTTGLRGIGAGTKSRARCDTMSVVVPKGGPQAKGRIVVVTSFYGGWSTSGCV